MSTTTNLVGQRIGAYVLDTELGGGAFGVVYHAHHVTHGMPVAIKVWSAADAVAAAGHAAFVREATVLQQLRHLRIPRLYAAGWQSQHPYLPYLVMEWIDATSLAQQIRERGRLPVSQVVALGIQVADALGYAHGQGIIHRDIKPANILVSPAGAAYVTDFGLSVWRGLPPHLPQVAAVVGMAGVPGVDVGPLIIGTVPYLAPEQLTHALSDACDECTDIYAVGVTLYEALTAQLPYRATSTAALLAAQRAGPATPPSTLDLHIPTAIDAVVLRALATDRAQRYQSVAALQSDLRASSASMAVDTPHVRWIPG